MIARLHSEIARRVIRLIYGSAIVPTPAAVMQGSFAERTSSEVGLKRANREDVYSE
jgi:hypothetical protein